MSDQNTVLSLEKVCFSYDKKMVLKEIDLMFEKGKVYAIIGKSGAGKTTLLSILSGLATPTSGVVYFQGKDIRGINQYDFRSRYVGVVFQSFNLLTKLTAIENVRLSMDIAKFKSESPNDYAYELLKQVGLDKEQADSRILKLSGGQQQRVAIARALSYQPEIILADEPTGSLDGETQAEIMAILNRLAKEENKCVILVTHSPEVAKSADQVIDLTQINQVSKPKPKQKKK